jgi:hypothetical protein
MDSWPRSSAPRSAYRVDDLLVGQLARVAAGEGGLEAELARLRAGPRWTKGLADGASAGLREASDSFTLTRRARRTALHVFALGAEIRRVAEPVCFRPSGRRPASAHEVARQVG